MEIVTFFAALKILCRHFYSDTQCGILFLQRFINFTIQIVVALSARNRQPALEKLIDGKQNQQTDDKISKYILLFKNKI